jgi:lipoprotein-anchoring transpeptidase ErfK/SrfK
VRPRSLLAALFVAAALVPVACSSSHAKTASDPSSTDATTATTTAGGPSHRWITEIATAKVPLVQVYRTKPGTHASTTSTGATTTTTAGMPAIPREGLNSVGVSADADGYSYANPTYFKNPLVFDVVRDQGAWLQVSLLARPNHQTGWIRRSDVTLSTTRYRLMLRLSTFDLQAFQGDRKVADTHVVVGRPDTPTPLGTFFLTEKIAKWEGSAYGPWILATSAYSETLDTFSGGLPQVAFHGTNEPQLIGTRASNGCIRMPDAVDQKLHDLLPPGTPITIVN